MTKNNSQALEHVLLAQKASPSSAVHKKLNWCDAISTSPSSNSKQPHYRGTIAQQTKHNCCKLALYKITWDFLQRGVREVGYINFDVFFSKLRDSREYRCKKGNINIIYKSHWSALFLRISVGLKFFTFLRKNFKAKLPRVEKCL
jgi:hypothetical protein